MSVGLTPTDEEILPCWFRPRTTDSDGRFILEGAPQGTYVNLTFWHPDFAVDEVTVNTTTDGSLTPGIRAFEITPVKPTFTHTMEPARPVQGRVTDKETGKPLAGLLVEMIPMRSHGGMTFHTRTDADGRYRVSGHAGANWYITAVYPPADFGYLAVSDMEQNWPAGAKVLEKNFALEKGRLVRGQVIDADTKRPVVGAAVVYQPTPGNPNNRNYDLRNTVLTDPSGRFAITALPGEEFLAVETPDESTVRVPVEQQYGRRTIFPHGFAAINVSQDGEPKPAEVAVRKGVALEAKAIGPDGNVVSDVVGFCEGIGARLIDVWDQGELFADGIFRLSGADPSRTYRVYLLQYERGIGAVVDLKPDPLAKQPVEVRLEPTGKVYGKVVSASGSPMQNGQVYPLLVIRDKEGEMSRNEVFRNTTFYSDLVGQKAMLAYSEKQKSNSLGEFVIDTLLPGVRFYIQAASGDGRSAGVPVSPLKPGEDRDLGTITLKEQP